MTNQITKSIVCGGLEPFESFNDLIELIEALRKETDDDIIIYTGFYKGEIEDKIEQLKEFPSIIVKFGRFIPDNQPHFDSVLGVNLASDNQYGEKIS